MEREREVGTITVEGSEAEAYALKVFCRKYNIGRTKAYDEINAGRLRAKKLGSRTLILARSAREWANNLPDFDKPETAAG